MWSRSQSAGSQQWIRYCTASALKIDVNFCQTLRTRLRQVRYIAGADTMGRGLWFGNSSNFGQRALPAVEECYISYCIGQQRGKWLMLGWSRYPCQAVSITWHKIRIESNELVSTYRTVQHADPLVAAFLDVIL